MCGDMCGGGGVCGGVGVECEGSKETSTTECSTT